MANHITSTGEAATGALLFSSERWFDPIEDAVRSRVRGFIEEVLEAELTEALQHFEMVRSDAHLADKARAITPAGRLVDPQDIANVVAFLCTPEAAMIRGQVITVDGGASLLAPGLEKSPGTSAV